MSGVINDVGERRLLDDALGEIGGEVVEGGAHDAARARGGVDVLAIARVDAHVVDARSRVYSSSLK